MPTSAEGFRARIDRLKADMVEQARRVQSVVERACDAALAADAAAGREAVDLDEAIDLVDVRIERAAVALLADATTDGAALDEPALRLVLTVVKVNNELERAADAAVAIAEQAETFARLSARPPQTFRVMSNSVIGLLSATCAAFDRMDAPRAQGVLACEDQVLEFKNALLRDVQQGLASGGRTVDEGLALTLVAAELERIADHCTNVAEQVIYVATGSIVRHTGGKWTDPARPED